LLHIGVTGHRFLAEVPKLQAGVDLALARIEAAYPGEDCSVLSSLAEGADRLVVERVLVYRPAARLIVPLPLPLDDYLQDFASAASRQAFLGWLGLAGEIIPPTPATSREDAYRSAGRYVLDHCDVLIVLWDGQEAQGKGGTGEIVDLARQRGLPLAWVHCGNRKPGTNEATSLCETQGTVTFERLGS
jgi:hypothetical protein